MNKRFVILLDSCTKEQEEAIRLSFKDLTWWHWLPNAWLLSDPAGAYSALGIRNHIQVVVPNLYVMVFELNATGDTWAGFGPSAAERNMFDWIRRNWEQKPKSNP